MPLADGMGQLYSNVLPNGDDFGQLYVNVLPNGDDFGQLYSNVLPRGDDFGQLYTNVLPRGDDFGQLYSNVIATIKPGKAALKEVILRDAPRGYWEFEEAAAATQFKDTLNGNILQERGDVTAALAGYDPASLAIAGFSAANYLDWPLQPVISGPHTVECLFRLSTLSSNSGIGLFGALGPNDFVTSAWVGFDGSLNINFGTGAAWLISPRAIAAGIVINRWYHLGMVARANGAEVYLDGHQVYTGSFTGTPLLTDANHLLRVGQIGSMWATQYPGTPATIDEFAIYDKALAPERFQVRADTELATAENAQFSGFAGWGQPL